MDFVVLFCTDSPIGLPGHSIKLEGHPVSCLRFSVEPQAPDPMHEQALIRAVLITPLF